MARDENRFQAELKKQRTRERLLQGPFPELADDPRQVGMRATTPCACSCPMCQESRRTHKRSKHQPVRLVGKLWAQDLDLEVFIPPY